LRENLLTKTCEIKEKKKEKVQRRGNREEETEKRKQRRGNREEETEKRKQRRGNREKEALNESGAA